MPKRVETADDVLIVGATRHPLRDVYHILLRLSWTRLLGSIAIIFLVLNATFALGYASVGGVVGVQNFRDAFFFRVHTNGNRWLRCHVPR